MTRDDLIADIVMRWEEAFDHGTDLAVADLCADHPELADDVSSRIAALKGMGWVKDAGTGGERETEARPTPKTLGGRYRIEGLIAEGGMGVVYRAHDPELDRAVAVKVPRPKHSTDDLVSEARRAAKLRHPGLVSVHDVGRDGDLCFIVSDLIDGTNLADRIAQGPLPWREAVRLVAGVADALGFAHDQGFVHRDIKPANVLLDKDGRPLLTDFGIAATFDEAQKDSGPGGGTLPFMAPEQVAGEAQLIDARTDLYSLGVVLYESLTGRLPYQARTPTALREQILFRSPVPVRSLVPGVPEAVEAVVARCLAKHPADRFGSASELSAALRNTLAPLPSARTLARFARPAGMIVVSMAMLGLIVAGVSLWPRPNTSSTSAASTTSEPTPFVADDVMNFDGQTRIVTSLERFAPCTLEAWVWPEEYQDTGTQAVIGSDIPTKYGISLGVTGVVPFVEIVPGLLKGTQAVPLKRWSHLAGVFGEAETRLYLQGKLVASGTATKAEGGTRFVVGNIGLDNPIDYFKGKVRAVRISRGERYGQGFTPDERLTPDDTTVLLYSAESVEGDVVKDRSGHGHHGRHEQGSKSPP
jgi:serine/threonine protein kinase